MQRARHLARFVLRQLALGGFAALVGAPICHADSLPASIQALRHAGPLNLQLRTNTGRDVSLSLEPQYTTQSLGDRLTSEQMEKLDRIRDEAPDKFEILQTLFPRQIAEYLLRTAPRVTPSDDPVQRLVWEMAADTGKAKTSSDGLDFKSPQNANALVALQKQYSPYQPVGMSLVGDTLAIGGKVVTERLSDEAASARRSPEQLAHDRYDALCRAFSHWRDGQITGNAYAGTIKSFLNDSRLATFTPDEVHRAYRRVFGRDLKVDLEADRAAAQIGHPITYNELQDRRR